MTSCVSSSLSHTLVSSLVLIVLLPAAVGQPNVQGQWSTLSYTMPINPVHVALLSNGKVLVVAGSGNCSPSLSGCPSGPPYGPSNGSGALLLDPVSGQTISQFSLSWDMFCNGMALLPDGRALIDGGTIQYGTFYGQPQVAIFDPATNTFSNTQNMAHGRWYPTVLTLGDGRVMTFSGLKETGGTNTSVEFYTASSGWSAEFTAPWTPDLYPRLHLLPGGKIFYSGSQTTSKLFDPSTTTWNTNVAKTNYLGRRTYGTSVLLPLTPANNYDPQVIIMGGGSPATNTTEIIDMGASTPAWHYGPNMSQARIEMNAVILPNGKVLALGGSLNDEDISSLSLNADLFDLSTVNLSANPPNVGTVSSAGANATERLYHSVALLLPDATVWVAGGNPSQGTYNHTMEIYRPPYLFDSSGGQATRPNISSAPTSISWGSQFTVQTPDAASISSVVLIRNGTVTHAFGMDQREVELSFTAGSGTLTVTAPPNGNIAPPGYYMLFILNNSGVPSVATFVHLTTATASPDFSISTTPSSQTVAPATGASYTVSLAPSNGFTGNVTFGVSGLPSGATASFTPSSVSGSGSSTMTISTSSSTPRGTYTLTITATSGTLSHSTQVTLVVTVPDFSVSSTPASQTVAPGSSATYTVNVTAVNGFTGNVSFSVSGLPSGAAATFTPTSVSGSGSSTMAVSTSSTTPAGSYALTITAASGSLTHSTQVTLVVTVPDFSVSSTPASQTVAPGSGASYTVNVTAVNGFTGNVTFGVSGLPSGATASFTPSSVSGSGSSTMTISTSSSTPRGTYTLTITATSGTLSHSTQVTLIVADFAISVSPSSQTAQPSSNTTYTVTITPLGPFSATVNFSVSGLPRRTSASFNPISVLGSGSSTLTISLSHKAVTGTYPLAITATAGGLTHSASVSLVIQ